MPYNFNSSMHSYGGRQAPSHMAHTPMWFFPIRVLQGILALVTLALSAFVIDVIGNAYDWYDWHGLGMNIWTSIFTFIFLIYIFLTALKFPRFYHNYAVAALELLLVIFWLVTFALLADHARDANNLKRLYRGTRGREKNALNSVTAAAVLSAINFLLFLITFIFFVLSLRKHRAGGHPMTAGPIAGGDHKMANVNPATGTQQHYGADPANNNAYANSNNGQYGSSPVAGQQPVVDQQYPPATYNQPVYNQQGHNAV